MSSIVFFAPFLALVTSCFAGAVLSVANRKYFQVKRFWLYRRILIAILFFALTPYFFDFLPKATTSTGFGVTPQAANAELLTFSIPLEASDVNFRHSYFSGVIDSADFAIGEKEFLSWMAGNKWLPSKFSTDDQGLHWVDEDHPQDVDFVWVTPVGRLEGAESDFLDVLNGYYYFDDHGPEHGDDGFGIVFDLDQGRAYMEWVRF